VAALAVPLSNKNIGLATAVGMAKARAELAEEMVAHKGGEMFVSSVEGEYFRYAIKVPLCWKRGGSRGTGLAM
jgi:hypothetical protein